MGADAFHVGHELVWPAKDVVIDALKYVTTRTVVGLYVHLVRIVDMAAAVRGGRYDLTGEHKLVRNGEGIMSGGSRHHHAQREEG